MENLPPDVLQPAAPKTPFRIDLDKPLPDLLRDVTAKVEQQYIKKALEEGPRQRRPLRPHLRPVAAEHQRQDRANTSWKSRRSRSAPTRTHDRPAGTRMAASAVRP